MRTTTVKLGPLCVSLGLLLAGCGAPDDPGAADDGALSIDADEKADGIATTSTYYWVRRDFRKCSAPRCGGYFVKRVNKDTTKCASGSWEEECYVSSIEFGNLDGSNVVLARGSIARNTTPFMGELVATEAYTEVGGAGSAYGSEMPGEPFYRVTDRGLRCVTAPCPSWHRAKLNQTYSSNFDGVDLSGAVLSSSEEAAAWDAIYGGGLYATGYVQYYGASKGRSFEAVHVFQAAPVMAPPSCAATLCGPGTTCVEGQGCVPLSACTKNDDCPQIYCITAPCPGYTCEGGFCVHQTTPPPPPKTCYRGGCSGQICSDREGVITTCNWRAEYACYHDATCEQQADGECGWTQTQELSACLAAPPM